MQPNRVYLAAPRDGHDKLSLIPAHENMGLQPLIAICGTTGVGKSQLAIELAVRLASASSRYGWKGAKIINADSMQVYEGLDVITNKVPEAERQGIPHLLMGFKKPGEQYVVGDWVRDALTLIDEIHRHKEIPIVVGGTSYWIQHLIFPNRLTRSTSPVHPGSSSELPWPQELADSISSLSSNLLELFNELPVDPPSAKEDASSAFQLHALLMILDPPMSRRWHWRDTRKVLRSLQIIRETRRKASDIIAEQSKASMNAPRFHTLCFWLYAEPSVLAARLDVRVDNMVKQGLLHEIIGLKHLAEATRANGHSQSDYTLGIFQSIGYKEFHDYLASPSPSEEAFQAAVHRTKLSTRQYAKRQVSWIRNKMLPTAYAANVEKTTVSTYLLDATELESWETNVLDPAIAIMQGKIEAHLLILPISSQPRVLRAVDFLAETELPEPSSLSDNAKKMLYIEPKDVDPDSVLKARRKIVCPICTVHDDRPIMLEEGSEWAAHQRTRVHRRLASKAGKTVKIADHPRC